MLAIPVSSSRLMNINPFAVPGRWRTITTPRDTHRAAVLDVLQVNSTQGSHFIQFGPMVSHRMAPYSKPGAAKVCVQALLYGHRRKRRSRLVFVLVANQGTGRAACPLNLPKRIAAMRLLVVE